MTYAVGVKRQTIRAGDPLTLRAWTDRPYRSQTVLLGQHRCTRVDEIDLRLSAGEAILITIAGETLYKDQAAAFARADGFEDVWELVEFIEQFHFPLIRPFKGLVYYW